MKGRVTRVIAACGVVMALAGTVAAVSQAVTVNYWLGAGIDSHGPLTTERWGSVHRLTRNAVRVLNSNAFGRPEACVWTTRDSIQDTVEACSNTLAARNFGGTILRRPRTAPGDVFGDWPDARAKYDY